MRLSFVFLVTVSDIVFAHPIHTRQLQPLYPPQKSAISTMPQTETLSSFQLKVLNEETSDETSPHFSPNFNPIPLSFDQNTPTAKFNPSTKPEPHKPYNDLAGAIAQMKAENQAVKDKKQNHEEMKKAAEEYKLAKELCKAKCGVFSDKSIIC